MHFLPYLLLLNVFKYLAKVISSCENDFFESTISKIRSDYSIAANDCWKISCFNCDDEASFKPDPVLFNNAISIPGVSIIVTNPFKIVNSLRSLVMPYYLSTMAILSPMRQLNKLLFPQLGRPIRETLYLEVGYLIVVHYLSLDFFFELIWRRSISWGVWRMSCCLDLGCWEKSYLMRWCNDERCILLFKGDWIWGIFCMDEYLRRRRVLLERRLSIIDWNDGWRWRQGCDVELL